MVTRPQMSAPLQGLGVVVTRPAHQAEPLCRMLENQGARAIRFPVLEIRDPQQPEAARAIVQDLERYDMAIFTSANAVHKAMALIQSKQRLPPVAAIGKATARVLTDYGIEVQWQPQSGFNSETLLAIPQMQRVANKRIVIFRGEGGRKVLADTLTARGACVSHAQVYRRGLPAVDPSLLLRHWRRGDIDVILVTSNESLRNLFAIVGELGQQCLYNTPLLVVSARACQLAQELGVNQAPLVAREASDEALVETLLKWQQTRLK